MAASVSAGLHHSSRSIKLSAPTKWPKPPAESPARILSLITELRELNRATASILLRARARSNCWQGLGFGHLKLPENVGGQLRAT